MGAWNRRRNWTALAVLGLAVAAAAPAAMAQDDPSVRIASSGDRTQEVRQAIKGGKARNVILFIGDGMGDSEITSAPTTPAVPPVG